MVKTMDCGSIMRGFESHYPPHFYKADDGVSPSGKAMDSDSIMRRFESCYPSQFTSQDASDCILAVIMAT